jgi:transposase
LRADYAAVKSALQLSWSNGPTEGHVNRLKMLKRQMYGRAKLDLLRKRILGWSTAGQSNNPITEFA